MSVHRRKCIRWDKKRADLPVKARPLAFKYYSKNSCLIECRAKIMMSKCNCLPYFYPNLKRVWKHGTECNVTGLACLAKEYSKISELEYTHTHTHY